MDFNRTKYYTKPKDNTKLKYIPDQISIMRNLLVKTTENITKQNDLIQSFQQTVKDNVSILDKLQTLKTAEEDLS